MTPKERARVVWAKCCAPATQEEGEAHIERALVNAVRNALYAAADAVVAETPTSGDECSVGITNAAWTVRRYARRICNKKRGRKKCKEAPHDPAR